MEEQRKPHDLDVFELTRVELNVVLSILGKLPFEQVSQVMAVLTTRPPSKAITDEQLAELAALVKDKVETNLETASDVSESSDVAEEEKTTEQ